ncbi:acyl-CoA N-acyltransferase [Chaetomium strumarium]|uniref:Acyl-CoA N-acyltransferase n=1 Tax=Chaetomium strumarium TaxID=1170767 RepID=A0AAJ0GYN0_9PEZI|nr:acyl-CoA N-acyltransferase [Chaetomium strumarium]
MSSRYHLISYQSTQRLEMPNFQVQPCTEEDIPRVFEILSDTFAHDHEYVDAVFHKHDTPEGRKNGAEQLLNTYRQDPYGHFIKVVDTDTGKTVGAAKWNIYKAGEVPPQPVLSGPYWPNDEEEEFAKAICQAFFAPRQKILKENDGRLVALEMLMVDPAYHGQGAGRLLVRWGTAHADRLGVEAFVEASERGRRLYQSEGFEGPYYEVPVPEKFADRRKQVYYMMRRPAKAVGPESAPVGESA